MPSSQEALPAAHGHESENLESYTLPEVVESHRPTPEHRDGVPTADQSTNDPQYHCLWRGPDGNQCLQPINDSTRIEHFTVAHGIKIMHSSDTLACDCGQEIKRKDLLRHVREHHARFSIPTFVVKSKGEKGKSKEEQEDADRHSDSALRESNESESAVTRDEVETRPDDADQQNDAFDARNDELLRDVLPPGDDFWGNGASGRCSPVKPQKAGLLSKLSTLFWRSKSRRCAQESVRPPLEIVPTARPTERVIILPWKEDKRDRQRSSADRHRLVTSTTDEGEHSSQHGNSQPTGHQSSVDTPLYRHSTATSATDTRDGQTSDGEHDGGCLVCRSKRDR